MDTNTLRAIKTTRDNFIQFSRNGRWGTCADCPRDSAGNVYPEFCDNTERYDHHLNVDSLAENFKIVKDR